MGLTSEISKALRSFRRRVGSEPPRGPERKRPSEGTALVDFGITGLQRHGRLIDNERDLRLRGKKKALKYEEMLDNSGPLGGAILLMRALLSRVHLHFEAPEGGLPEATPIAEFYQSCLADLDTPWVGIRSEIFSCIQHGFALFEPLYKIRGGESREPLLNSRFNDGRIGWRDFEPRAQTSIDEWVWAGNNVVGVYQMVPGEPGRPYLPMTKALNFVVNGDAKRNPEGRSFLRSAVRPYQLRVAGEEIEAIGLERNLDGLPYALVPPSILSPGASEAERQTLRNIQKMVTGVRRDDKQGVVFPAKEISRAGVVEKTGYEFGILATGVDPSKADPVLRRYRSDEMTALLSEFLLLGSESSGSWALHDSSTRLLGHALGFVLLMVVETFNQVEVPRLARINGFPTQLLPEMRHGDIESADLQKVADYVDKLMKNGALHGDGKLEGWLRAQAGMPQAEAPELRGHTAKPPADVIPSNAHQVHDE